MIDPIVEVERLKHNLRMAGLPLEEVDQIGDLATQDIDNTIYGLTQNYLEQAKDVVSSLGGQQLADELRSTKQGARYIITTESGVTDFSAPPFEMLPHLLKNAEVTSKGELHKVIPLSSKSNTTPTNIFDTYKDRNTEVNEKRSERKEMWDDIRASNAIERKSISFSGLAQAKKYIAKRQAANKENNSVNSKEAADFKSASSKQNASTDWVLPAKDMNITNILNDINNQLESDVDSAVSYILDEYGGLI